MTRSKAGELPNTLALMLNHYLKDNSVEMLK